jgi:hypothetical protein
MATESMGNMKLFIFYSNESGYTYNIAANSLSEAWLQCYSKGLDTNNLSLINVEYTK